MNGAIILIAGLFIAGYIIYLICKGIEKSSDLGVGDTISFAIIIGVLWYFEVSMEILLGVTIIAFFIENLQLAFANYHNKQLSEQFEKFERLKNCECEIYKNLIKQWEERLYEKAKRVPKKWIKQWDWGVKQWERGVVEIKKPGHFSKVSGHQHPLIQDICGKGYADTFFLYEQALKTELTAEHMERINELMMRPIFKKTYYKVVRLMKENGVIVEKFIDPLTKKERHKPTMLLLHWWLYTVDGMITALYEKQQREKASEHYADLASLEIYFEDIPKDTEYKALKEIMESFRSMYSMPDQCERLCICKMELLSLLYDISSDYKAARETFIYYKRLIDAVKEGYIAFDCDYRYGTVEYKFNEYQEKDKEEKKGLCIDQEIPTFEEAYKLGVKEWMKVVNKKCGNRLIFWKMLVGMGNSKEKLHTIFGDEKVKALEEVIKKEQEQFDGAMKKAILENENFHYHESREYLIGYL